MTQDYNTQREPLYHKEYGRNIKKLTSFIKTIEDKEERTKYAYTLVKLMKQIIPGSFNIEDTMQKYWDDLQIVSGFDIDVDAPFPIPDKDELEKKPKHLDYHKYRVKFKHYGRNVELLVEEALKIEDAQKREDAIIYIGKLMKSFHASWSLEMVDDHVIMKNIDKLSDGKLTIDPEKFENNSNLFEVLYHDKPKNRNSNQRRSNRNQGKNNGKNRGRRRN